MGGIREIHAGLAALLLAIFLLVPSGAFGEASDFLPTIYATEGVLEVNMTGENNEGSAAGNNTKSSDAYSIERLRIALNGFVYHPRFMQFLIKGTGGLSQERYKNSQEGAFSETKMANNYEFRTKILPEHPYNLELYTMSVTPLVQGRSSIDSRPTAYQKGAIFRYADRPVYLNLDYDVNTLESRATSAETRTAKVSGGFNKGPVNNTASYSRSNSSASGIYTTSDYSFFENTISLIGASLTSSARQTRMKQSALFAVDLDTDQVSWTERFNAPLPWNFFTSVSYDFHKDTMTREKTGTTPVNELASETRNSNFTLTHQLYESVRSAYTHNYSTLHSSLGDTKSMSNAVNSFYTKKIPDGRITVGVQGSRMNVNQDNGALVVGQFYHAPLLGNFTLAVERIDLSTLSIKALTSAGAFIELTQNTDYVVEPTGGTELITIVSLPPAVTLGRPLGYVYTFSVTYSSYAVTTDFQLTSVGYSVNLALLDSLLNPYYNRVHTRQAVLAGSIPGGPQDTKTNTVGMIINGPPYRLLSEYKAVQSEIYPSRSRRNSMEYLHRATKTINFSATARFTVTDYMKGISGSAGYSERITGCDIRLQKTVPRNNFNLSFAVSYDERRAMLATNVYYMSTDLIWLAGKLSVNLGASLNHSTTTSAIFKQTLLSQYYYLTVSRKLF